MHMESFQSVYQQHEHEGVSDKLNAFRRPFVFCGSDRIWGTHSSVIEPSRSELTPYLPGWVVCRSGGGVSTIASIAAAFVTLIHAAHFQSLIEHLLDGRFERSGRSHFICSRLFRIPLKVTLIEVDEQAVSRTCAPVMVFTDATVVCIYTKSPVQTTESLPPIPLTRAPLASCVYLGYLSPTPFVACMPRYLCRARELVISSARKPADPNEETLHWLRCVELGKTVYAPRFRVSDL